MAPKPFPFPIGVGIDVCQISRIVALLRQETLVNRWARKVFTRLEWPALCRRFQGVDRSEAGTASPPGEEKDEGVEPSPKTDLWMLPRLSIYSKTSDDTKTILSMIGDERSKLGVLTRHLAGRWAAKEAVIKAHRHRQLYMQDISIVRLPHQLSKSQKLVALIDPVCNRVEMSEKVAALRALRGFGLRSQELQKVLPISKGELKETSQSHEKRPTHFNRRRRIKETERQTAELNISHDGEYAFAVCMAFDSVGLHPEGRQIVDDGTGPPMHEPQWGDEGWLDQDDSSEGWRDMSLYDLLEEPEPPMDTEAYGKDFRESLASARNQEHWMIPPLP